MLRLLARLWLRPPTPAEVLWSVDVRRAMNVRKAPQWPLASTS